MAKEYKEKETHTGEKKWMLANNNVYDVMIRLTMTTE